MQNVLARTMFEDLVAVHPAEQLQSGAQVHRGGRALDLARAVDQPAWKTA